MKTPLIAACALVLTLALAGVAGAETNPPAKKKHAHATHPAVAPTTGAHVDPAQKPTTEPPAATAHTELAPTQAQGADAHGKLSSLRADGLTVTREDGTALSCRLTATQASYLAAKLTLGNAVRILCSLDGSRYTLAKIEPFTPGDSARTAPVTPPAKPSAPAAQPSTPTTQPQAVDAHGKLSALRADGLTVTREDGTALSCGLTPTQAAYLAARSRSGTLSGSSARSTAPVTRSPRSSPSPPATPPALHP